MKELKALAFGEILWDIFGEKRKIGSYSCGPALPQEHEIPKKVS